VQVAVVALVVMAQVQVALVVAELAVAATLQTVLLEQQILAVAAVVLRLAAHKLTLVVLELP
jgi:hypothetical protein